MADPAEQQSEARRAMQRVWTLYVCPDCGNHRTAFALCEHQADQAGDGEQPLGRSKFVRVEVLPTSLLGELAEWCEAKARMAETESAGRSEPDSFDVFDGKAHAFNETADKLRSLLSQEEPDGEQ